MQIKTLLLLAFLASMSVWMFYIGHELSKNGKTRSTWVAYTAGIGYALFLIEVLINESFGFHFPLG